MTQNTTILFAGSGEFGIPTLRTLIAAGFHIRQVFTQPNRPAGRGKKLTPTPIAQLAVEAGLHVIQTTNINAETLDPADLMVVIAFGQKIGQPAVQHPRLGSVNLHSSLLPKYRGAAPINWAILNGDTFTGNSIIRLAEKMDAGEILAQSHLQIGESETAGELHDRLAVDGASMMINLIAQLQDGSSTEKTQDHSQATLAPKLSRQTAIIDWSKPANVVVRQINGLSPWPGCRVRLMEADAEIAKLTLSRSKPATSRSNGAPGTIQFDGTIAAGDANGVEILEVQPEGKRPMKLADFRNGRPWTAGLRLEAIS